MANNRNNAKQTEKNNQDANKPKESFASRLKEEWDKNKFQIIVVGVLISSAIFVG